MSKRKRIVQAETPDGQLAGEAVPEAVENQLRDDKPPPMNARLILDEGDRNTMTVKELAKRMSRRALEWLRKNAWSMRPRVRIDVLVANHSGIEFWRSVGFAEYCVTLERTV